METFYSLLGLEPDASREDIKKVYRDMALMYHPDRYYGRTDEERRAAEEFFKRVNAAKEVLLDEEKRAAYDRTLTVTIPRAKPYEEVSAVVEEMHAAREEVPAAVGAMDTPREETPTVVWDTAPWEEYDPRPRPPKAQAVDTAYAVVHEMPPEGIPDPAVQIDRAVEGLRSIMDQTFVHLDELDRFNDAFIRDFLIHRPVGTNRAKDLYQRRRTLVARLRRRAYRTQNLVLDLDDIPYMRVDGREPPAGAAYTGWAGAPRACAPAGPGGPTPDRADPWSKEVVRKTGTCPFCHKEADAPQSYCYYCGGVF